jgi:hypothetical protein
LGYISAAGTNVLFCTSELQKYSTRKLSTRNTKCQAKPQPLMAGLFQQIRLQNYFILKKFVCFAKNLLFMNKVTLQNLFDVWP